MKQRLEEFIKTEAERGCEHCIHHKEGCQLIECWKMNDEHFRRICTKLFAIDNASEFFDNHQ